MKGNERPPRLTNGMVMPSVVAWHVKEDGSVYVEAEHRVGLAHPPDKKIRGECVGAEYHLLPEGDFLWYLRIRVPGGRARTLAFPCDDSCGWFVTTAQRIRPKKAR